MECLIVTNLDKTPAKQPEEIGWKTSLAATFAVVVLSGASVAAIVFSSDLNERQGPKGMDASAKTLFNAQGYDVIKRNKYKASVVDNSMVEGETATYVLKKREGGERVEGELVCGRAALPDMVTPRMCSVTFKNGK